MTAKLPRWIVIWFVISMPIIVWDVSFVLLRPASMPGGSLSFLWIPYTRYIQIDHSYGDLTYGFVPAQALMSCLEVVMAVVALVLSARRPRPLAVLLVFAVSILTCAKTVLILVIELVTGLEHVGHNAISDLVLMYLLPNSVWVVMPALVAWVTGKTLVAAWAPRA